MVIITTTRVWFLYYDLNYNVSLISHEWWSTISDDKDWFIKNKNKYGSWSNFMWKLVTFIIISWLIQIFIMRYYIREV